MMTRSFDTLTAAEIAAGIAAGEFSAAEVCAAALDAIAAREPEVQAFLQVTPELAQKAAARIDAARAAGEALPPLAGVPVAIKDNMNQLGSAAVKDEEKKERVKVKGFSAYKENTVPIDAKPDP